MNISRVFQLTITLALLALLPLGCASGPKINWNARVGTYTYDQAVLEFGPPAKFANLTDGTRVAEWQTQRGYATVDYVPSYVGHHRYWHGYYSTPIVTRQPDVFLRLTFDPTTGRLAAWKKIIQ